MPPFSFRGESMHNPTQYVDYEKQVIPLLRRKIIPFAFLLYFFNVMDRVNIGFAALGMNEELSISASQFGTISSIFFISYILFQIPSNIILPKLGPRHWIGFLFVSWGVVTLSTFWATSGTYIAVTRFLIGVFEAGFFPGMMFYIACWFPAKERGYANGLFMLSGAAAQLFASPISGWIVENVHTAQYAGWRWLFVIEGVPTILLGMVIFVILVNSPKEANWLNPQQKEWLINKLEEEKIANQNQNKLSFTSVIADYKLWQLVLGYMFVQAAVQSAGFWLPIQLKAFDSSLTGTSVGLIMAFPFLFALFITPLWSKHSDKKNERIWHTAIPMGIVAISFLSVALIDNMTLKIILLTLYGIGLYAYYGPFWSLPPTLLSPAGLAVGIAIINTGSGIGGFFATKTIGFIEGDYGPAYSLSFQAVLCLLSMLIILSIKRSKSQ